MRKNIFSILRTVMLALLCFPAQVIFGQAAPKVTVSLNIMPPYSPYYRDYAGMNKDPFSLNNTIVTLIPDGNLHVYLTASLMKDDNSIIIRPKENYKPALPITLAANVPQTLSGFSLKNMFGGGNLSDLDLTGVTPFQIMNNQVLPEGNYTLCVQAYNYESGMYFGEDCRNIYISYNEPPQIISPADMSTVTAVNPQFVLVTWTPAVTGLAGVNYRLRIAKLLPGVTPTDALKNATQLILDRSNIVTTNFLLDVASGIILDTGSTYAMQVTASSALTFFKNNGESEAVLFIYKSLPGQMTGSGPALDFITPAAKKNYIEVSKSKPFYMNWNWFDTNGNLVDTAYKDLGAVKYEIRIENPKKMRNAKPALPFSFTRAIHLDNNILKSYLSLKKHVADSIGFVDQQWYKATLTAYDAQSKVVATAGSVDFQYRIIKDQEPMMEIAVDAVVKYMFRDSLQAMYNATNTPVAIEVLKKISGPQVAALPTIVINNQYYAKVTQTTGMTDALGALHDTVSAPLIMFGDSIWLCLALPNKYYIDTHFPVLAVKAKETDTGVNFGQLVAETYAYSLKVYVKKAYTSYSISARNGEMSVALADSVFNSEEYPYVYSEENGGTMIYAVESKKPALGITMVIYRKNKQSYVPPVEGDISDYSHTMGYTEVGRAVTQLEKSTEGDVTYVTFDRLLASIFNGDEYYILALNGENDPQKPSGSGPQQYQLNQNLNLQYPTQQNNQNAYQQNNFQHYNAQMNLQSEWNLFNPYQNSEFAEEGFVANEMPFKLSLPLNVNSTDSLYRNVSTEYDIVSTKPPTSLVKGRLLYHWKTDKNDQLRPYSNSTFRIVVDYLVDGKPIGSVKSFQGTGGGGFSFSQLFFVPEGQDEYSQGMELLDHYATMAVGKTDAQGNFEIDVVNINQKGSLGKGTIVSKGASFTPPAAITDYQNLTPDEIINPAMDGFGFPGEWNIQNSFNQNNGVQNMINGNSNVTFNTSTGAFDMGHGNMNFGGGGKIKPGMNGPRAENEPYLFDETTANDGDLVNFERVYRIIPDNQYIYRSKETFAVQAFEAYNIPYPITSYVKEVKLKVCTKDQNNSDLTEMRVTVFRSIEDKTPDLPLGEGNGQYRFEELISPQYNNTGEPFDVSQAQYLNTGGNVFTKKYEIIWPDTAVFSNGCANFNALLAGFDDYYVEACSDPTGTKTYKATFASVQTVIDENNSEYWLGNAMPPTVQITMKLQPLPSRALIRLLDNSTQNAITGAMGGRVKIKKDGSSYTYTANVDAYGYVEFLADRPPLSYFASPVKFEGSATGYKPVQGNALAKFTFNPTGSQFFYNYLLDPAIRMQGHIVNMDLISRPGVPAYIKVEGGKTIETNNDGHFDDLPVPAVAGTRIDIIPKDVGFFDSTYVLKNADVNKSIIDLNDFGVYRRRHRIRFMITTSSDSPIANATVQLGDTVRKTNIGGYAFYNFENVSVNNFTFVIRGPAGQNYIPKTLSIKNTESKNYVTVKVKLETGSEVHGKVTLDGQPVKNARIYLDVSQQNNVWYYPGNTTQLGGDANLVVAYSDAAGNYSLKGVPVNNQIVYLHCTLDTSFTVNGDLQPADIKNKTATTNFTLTSFRSMLVNNIYGFPLTVEKIVPTKPDSSEATVSGVVHWSKAISDFYLDEVTQVLRIENVTYKAMTVNGKKVGVPQEASVTINGVSSLKFKYLDKYNVKLTRESQGGNYIMYPQSLSISKENDLGVIRGKVSIVDNSFNYPSTYLNFSSAVNSFYLADKVNETTVNTNISAVTSAMSETQTNNNYYQNYTAYLLAVQSYISGYQSQPKAKYYLANEKGEPIQFKLIEFNANATPTKSFIDENGKIHLNVNLQCHIPNAQPENFSLNIDDMVLDNNQVYPASGSSPITLGLEQWTLNIKNWSFSTEEGGIVSNNGLINTSAIDIPFTKFVLRHDLFLMDQFQLQSLKMAGGSIALKNINTQNAALVFDSKTGIDLKPHWRFSISGNPAAELPPLKDLSGTLKLNYIQILSNNESVFQLQQQPTPLIIRENSLAKYSPESIFNGPDYISIAGALNVGAPRVGDISLHLVYKNANNIKLESVQADFEGQGFVHFVARDPGNNVPNITINKNQITILGNVVEKPEPSFNEIQATFIATVGGAPFYTGGNPVYKVEMDKGFVTQLDKQGNSPGSTGHKLVIDNGGMSVSGSDWSILTYEGMMSSNTADNNTKPLKVKYAVMGDISADASGLEVSNIETPFGAMKMVFDFSHKRMIGSITANNIPLGTNTISGTVETLFDPAGFYIAGGASADIKLPNPYVDGTYNMGFMIGSYPITDELWNVVNSYKNPAVKNDCYRKNFPNLSGFYFTIDRVIIDKSIGFDFILASGYVRATALLGADVYANFKPPLTIGVEAHAFAQVAAGLGSITGTSISGSLNALAALKFIYANNQFNADGTIDLGFAATISQSLIATTITKSIDINCHAAAGTSGFSFSLGSGDPVKECIPY